MCLPSDAMACAGTMPPTMTEPLKKRLFHLASEIVS